MSNQPTLNIEPRTDLGTACARKLRRQGRIPGILYGHGAAEPISLDAAAFRHQIKTDQYGAVVVRMQQDGRDVGSALVKAVQSNPLKGQITHVDLLKVSAEDRIHVNVPVVLHGEPAATRTGGVLEQSVHTLNLRCRASDVPAHIAFDVSSLEIGDAVHAGQLALPTECELLDKTDDVIAVILTPTIPALEEPVTMEVETPGPELTGEKQTEDFPSER